MNKKILVIGLSGESVFLNLDHFNKPGETIQAVDKKTEPGGKGYNQAIALGKLGCDVTFITALGNDGYSDECIRVLKENNVKPCIVYKNIPGSYAVISVDSKGENNVIVYKGASELITFEDIYNNYKQNLDSAEIILLQLEFNEELTTQLIDYLYEKDKKSGYYGNYYTMCIGKCLCIPTCYRYTSDSGINSTIFTYPSTI